MFALFWNNHAYRVVTKNVKNIMHTLMFSLPILTLSPITQSTEYVLVQHTTYNFHIFIRKIRKFVISEWTEKCYSFHIKLYIFIDDIEHILLQNSYKCRLNYKYRRLYGKTCEWRNLVGNCFFSYSHELNIEYTLLQKSFK